MLHRNFLLSLSLYIIVIHAGFLQDKLFNNAVLHLDRITGECRGQNVPAQAFFRGIKAMSTSIFITNYTLIIKEGGLNKLVLTITIKRCRSKENLDTCEAYFKQPGIDFCKMIYPNNLRASNTIKPFPIVPPISCPLNKGIYHAYNFSYDLSPFLLFKLNGWYWKVKIDIFNRDDENRILYCSHMEGYYTYSNKSKKT